MPVDSNGLPWNGTFVTTTGNVIMDMLFNFRLECGAGCTSCASTRR